MAVDDDLLRKNPFDFELASVIVDDSVIREAISRKDERIFLDFIRNDKHYSQYYDGMCILFKTGLRISEFAGLTLNDVDLRARVIHVDHQLQRTTQMEYIIEDPKTESGTLPWDIVYMPHARFKATFGSKIQYMDAIYYFCTTFAGYEVP